MDADREAFDAQIRENYGRIVYTHKTHEVMADRYDGQQKRIKLWQILLAAGTTISATGTVFSDAVWVPYFTVLVAVITTFLSGYAKDIDPGTSAQRHREVAADIWAVREQYLGLITDIQDPSIPLEDLRIRRDDLRARQHEIYRTAPHTDRKAYEMAQNRLKNKEDMTFSEKELNTFMPPQLRKAVD